MSADQRLGEFTFIEQIIPAGAGPPAHIHERRAQGFYLLSGEVEFVVGHDDEVMQTKEIADVRGLSRSIHILSTLI